MTEPERPRRPWRDVAATFLRLGVTSYGDPAIMGIMQAELQEKRAWVSRERFLEGLSLVNMLPGATATQLAIFIGLGLTAARTTPQAIICLLALVTAVATPLGIATILVLAGAAGLLIFHSRSLRTVAIVSVVACLAVLPVAWRASSWPASIWKSSISSGLAIRDLNSSKIDAFVPCS